MKLFSVFALVLSSTLSKSALARSNLRNLFLPQSGNDEPQYLLVNPATNLAIEVAGGDCNALTNIELGTRDDTNPAQLFRDGPNGSIINVACGTALDIEALQCDKGTNVINYFRNNQENQQFVFASDGTIYNPRCDMVLDIFKSRNQDGTNIIIWPNHGGNNQKFVKTTPVTSAPTPNPTLAPTPSPTPSPQQIMSLAITNTGRNQPFSNFFYMVSSCNDHPFFEFGEEPSPELAELAENGNPEPLRNRYLEGDDVSFVGQTTDGATNQGDTRFLKVVTNEQFSCVSLGAMTINTNDGFVGIANEKLKCGDVIKGHLMDAGSEANTELCENIPGPACLDIDPDNTRVIEGAEGFTHVHPGFHGVGDLLQEDHDWRNPMMEIRVLCD